MVVAAQVEQDLYVALAVVEEQAVDWVRRLLDVKEVLKAEGEAV